MDGTKKYTSDLTDMQWEIIKKFIPKKKITRPRVYQERQLLNAIFFVLRTGCQWRDIPSEYPPFHIVHKYFRRLVKGLYLERTMCVLNKRVAKKQSKRGGDLVLIVDTKSVRTTEYASNILRGYDGNKKIKGLKLCPVLDRLRRCWRVEITPANQSEFKGVYNSLYKTMNTVIHPYASYVIGDRYYDAKPFKKLLYETLDLTLVTLKRNRNKQKKFVMQEEIELQKIKETKAKAFVNPYRYIIEQFFAHLEKARRLIVCYERCTKSYTGFVKLRVIQLLLRRL